MRNRKRQGSTSQWQPIGEQQAAEFGQKPFRAGRGAGLVNQPGERGGQIHASIMPRRPQAVIRAMAIAFSKSASARSP
jgi:hypothetical protein